MPKPGSEVEEEHNDSASDKLVPILGNSRAISHPEWRHNGRHVVVATLDGQVSLLDHAGKILWSICTGQLFSSTISSLQLSEDGKYINLIPSLAGGLYKYDGDSLQPIPLNADSLLKKSFKLSNDVVITGGKELRTFGVDVDSGSIRYECGFGDCYYPSQAASDPNEEKRPVLVIKKTISGRSSY
jgi:translation initiation factor 2-alpha kinase 3